MRTKEGIEKLIREMGLPEQKNATKRSWNQIQKRIRHLRTALMYLGTDPDKDFLTSDFERLRNKMEKAEEGYEHWLAHDYDLAYHGKAPKTAFNKYIGIPSMRRQIKMLGFLLQDDGDNFKV